jgi:hypothetical protein
MVPPLIRCVVGDGVVVVASGSVVIDHIAESVIFIRVPSFPTPVSAASYTVSRKT